MNTSVYTMTTTPMPTMKLTDEQLKSLVLKNEDIEYSLDGFMKYCYIHKDDDLVSYDTTFIKNHYVLRSYNDINRIETAVAYTVECGPYEAVMRLMINELNKYAESLEKEEKELKIAKEKNAKTKTMEKRLKLHKNVDMWPVMREMFIIMDCGCEEEEEDEMYLKDPNNMYKKIIEEMFNGDSDDHIEVWKQPDFI